MRAAYGRPMTIRRFKLARDERGDFGEGVQFSDGTVCLRTSFDGESTTTLYESIESLERTLGDGWYAVIVWLDDDKAGRSKN